MKPLSAYQFFKIFHTKCFWIISYIRRVLKKISKPRAYKKKNTLPEIGWYIYRTLHWRNLISMNISKLKMTSLFIDRASLQFRDNFSWGMLSLLLGWVSLNSKEKLKRCSHELILQLNVLTPEILHYIIK